MEVPSLPAKRQRCDRRSRSSGRRGAVSGCSSSFSSATRSSWAMSTCLFVARSRRSAGIGSLTSTVLLPSSAIAPPQDESHLICGHADGCTIGGGKRGEARVLALFVRYPADFAQLCLHLVYWLSHTDLGTAREDDRCIGAFSHHREPIRALRRRALGYLAHRRPKMQAPHFLAENAKTAAQGFEPRLPRPERGVLPLHQAAMQSSEDSRETRAGGSDTDLG